MTASNVSRFDFFRDLILAMTALALGRLFPTMKSPPADLTGKVSIVTGGNSGIGLEIALEIARRGSTVYLACRNASKGEDAVSQIVAQVPESKGRVRLLTLDTSSLDSVRAFARKWETLDTKIDLLFHNAGISNAPAGQEFSPDGFPMIYATNFLGSFLLTHLLEPHLSTNARVIMTSSTGQYGSGFTSDFSLGRIVQSLEPGFHVPESKRPAPESAVYGNTKGMQVAFAKLLQRYFDRKSAETGLRSRKAVHAFTPGFTATPIFGKAESGFFVDPLFWLLKMTYAVVAVDVGQGAATGVYLACTDDEMVVGEGAGGGYWDRMTPRVSKIDMMSKDEVERLWVRWEADAGVEWR